MNLKFIEYNIMRIMLFMYSLSLIIFTQIPQYSYISLVIGFLLVIFHFFFAILHKEKILFMNSALYIYFIFIVFSTASILWSSDFDLSFVMVTRMIYLLITLIVIYTVLNKYNISSSFHYGIIFGIFLNFILYFDPISLQIETWLWLRYQGTTGNPNVLAIVAIFSIFSSILLLYIHKYKNYLRYLHILNISISIFLILTTASKKGILFGALLLFMYLFFSKNRLKIITYGTSILVLIGTIAIQYGYINMIIEKISYGLVRFEKLFGASGSYIDKSSKHRIELIENGLNKFAEQPLFGFGIDNFRYYFDFYAHNNYVELLFNVGIIGTLIYYSIYFVLIKNALRIKDSFLKYMIISLFFIILIMDIALVSYFYKFLLTYVILISYYIEKYKDKGLLDDK